VTGTAPDEQANRVGVILGVLSALGLAALVVVSLPRAGRLLRLSYERWLLLHRFTGLFVIIGALHGLLVDRVIVASTVPRVVILFISLVGVSAYLYTELVMRRVEPSADYTVAAVQRADEEVLEVQLAPVGTPLRPRAGQFIFLSFGGDDRWREHPFSVAGVAADGALRLAIRALGADTRRLHERLRPGMNATVTGPFGMFDQTLGGPRQVWVAGGIGRRPVPELARRARPRRRTPGRLLLQRLLRGGGHLPAGDPRRGSCRGRPAGASSAHRLRTAAHRAPDSGHCGRATGGPACLSVRPSGTCRRPLPRVAPRWGGARPPARRGVRLPLSGLTGSHVAGSYTSVVVVLILSAVQFALAVALLGIGAAGLRGTLAPNRWAGVRTPAAMASVAAFRLANRAAGPGMLAAGTLLAASGAATIGFDGVLRVLAVGMSALGALGLALAAGALGATAAEGASGATAAEGASGATAAGGALRATAADRTPAPSPAGTTRCATCPGCDLLGAAGVTARAPAAVTNPSCPAHP